MPITEHLAPTTRPASRRVWLEALAVLVGTALAGWLSIRFEVDERIEAWTHAGERYQLDELRSVILFFVLGLLWFARRRYRDARQALDQQRRAEAQLAHSLDENRRLVRQTLALREADHKHLARELHDELGQYLNAIKIDAVSLQNEVNPTRSPALAAILRNTDHVYLVTNHLIRRLRPVGLDELGLAAAIESSVDEWRLRLPAMAFSVSVAGAVDDLDEVQALTVYRIVQEGLTNVVKHSTASHIAITIDCRDELLAVEMTDDGDGRPSGNGSGNGLGLIGMRERVQALGGELFAAHVKGNGFRLSARFPVCPKAAA